MLLQKKTTWITTSQENIFLRKHKTDHKQTKQKIFETVDVSSKQFSAKIPSDDALEAAEIVSGNLEKNQSAWDVFDSIESENEMLRQISEEQHKQKNISDDE